MLSINSFNSEEIVEYERLTLDHYTIFLKHLVILHDHILISLVDYLPSFVDAKSGMQILNDSDVLHPSQFQSAMQ